MQLTVEGVLLVLQRSDEGAVHGSLVRTVCKVGHIPQIRLVHEALNVLTMLHVHASLQHLVSLDKRASRRQLDDALTQVLHLLRKQAKDLRAM